MITVKVVHESSGKPAHGRRVALGFSEGIRQSMTSSERSDDSGEAHFEVDNGTGEVFVDGSRKHRGYLKGRIVVYI